jgi:hypothetical protein
VEGANMFMGSMSRLVYILKYMALEIPTGAFVIIMAKYFPLASNKILSGLLWYLVFYTVTFWTAENPDVRLFFNPVNFYILGSLWVLFGACGLADSHLVTIVLYSIFGHYANKFAFLSAMVEFYWD